MAVAVVLAALLTLWAWLSGVEFKLPIKYGPHHPGLFLAAECIGAVGMLRFKAWGYAIYSLLALGLAVFWGL